MRIINIIDSADTINFGIWNSIIVNADVLINEGIEVELWFPESAIVDIKIPNARVANFSKECLNQISKNRKLDSKRDLIVTHGAWRYPSRWGSLLKDRGFKWIYVPHGMLEPWPMQQKWLKKKIYFGLVEKRLVNKADLIRSVSLPEKENLQRIFPYSEIAFIPNGVSLDTQDPSTHYKNKDKKTYLFLSRLHHKKNIISLAEAWLASTINNNADFELIIAGPDQGELQKLNDLLKHSSNMKYIGSVYGEQKNEVFNKSDFYILPSFSEGLPSAMLEAMGFGLIPIITEGCNFPDAFIHNLGVKITTEKDSIRKTLEETSAWDRTIMHEKSNKNRDFIRLHYSINAITKMQMELFNKILPPYSIAGDNN